MKDSRDDDLEARLKRDPRREPTVPPQRDPRRDPTDPPPAPEGEPLPPKVEIVDSSASPVLETSASDPAPAPQEAQAPSVVTSSDPRLAEVEKAVEAGNWDAVLAALGPAEDAGRLPPNLGVLYAIARKEKERADAVDPALTDIAIRCMAGVLGVDRASPIALLIAKRLLRKNPTAWRQRPAPRPTISILIILGGLLLGGTLSWLISFGYLHVTLHLP
ncbi:MAG: hypothetical protein HY898_09165 [Deltaproteobacteria bacterium]|nr:hypothetical protein [Deltaproteobacteria bacterium]